MNIDRLTRVLEEHNFTPELREGGTEVSIPCPLCFDEQSRLYINTNTGLWICFRCSSRGNLITLGTDLLEMGELEARETALSIRGPEGRDIPIQAAAPTLTAPTEEAGIELPEGFIWDDGEGLAATYLHASRRVNRVWVREFGMGYVLQGYYAGRIVVPVMTGGVLRTWVARDWTEAAEKKVLMPRDSQAGRALFNYDRLSKAPVPHSGTIIVEGVFDALALLEHNLSHVVATLGAHITDQQRRLLKRLGRTNVVLLRDGDTAGRTAAIEEARELHAARFDVSIAQLPDDVDPGSATVEELTAALHQAKTVDQDVGLEALREVHQ